jgi:SAM-dependent methyltransferase
LHIIAARCTGRYLSAMPPTEFSGEKFQNPYPPGIENHYWTIARHRIIFRRLRTMVKARDDLILDVGCGRGITVQWLRERGLETIGCDLGVPTPATASVAPHLYLGAAAESLPPDLAARVKIILLLDVLEHLPEPAAFLSGLFRHFGNCRQAIFTVPARKELWSNYDKYYGHVMRYNLEDVRRLAKESDCELQSAGYFFHALWMPARIMCALGKERSTKIFPPGPGTRPLHRIIAGGFFLEELILPKFVAGSSILGVIHRPRLTAPGR